MRRKIRAKRRLLDITQEKMARDLGVSAQTINNVERGRGMSLKLAKKISEYLNLTMDEVLEEE